MPNTPRLTQIKPLEQQTDLEPITQALLAPQASIAAKYLYNQLGSKLFEAITYLPEYYPTRTEYDIVKHYRQEIREALPKNSTLIDLGAGNCQKGANLIEILAPTHYVAIDISVNFLQQSICLLQMQYPELQMHAVGMDFSKEFYLPKQLNLPENNSKVFFYPGSSISNFNPNEATAFLKQVKQQCTPGSNSGLLLGVDLIKNKNTLEHAYDDALGVTAAFNRNVLLHLNELMNTDFDLNHWDHIAFFNSQEERVEMHLKCKAPVNVNWSSHSRSFRVGETIHTENSYKWTTEGFSNMLNTAGFEHVLCFTDPKKWFALFWAY